MLNPFQVADVFQKALDCSTSCQTDRTVPTAASFRNSAGVSRFPPHNTTCWRAGLGKNRKKLQVEEERGAGWGLARGCEGVSAHQSGLWLSSLLSRRRGPSTVPRAPCNSTPLNSGGLLKL